MFTYAARRLAGRSPRTTPSRFPNITFRCMRGFKREGLMGERLDFFAFRRKLIIRTRIRAINTHDAPFLRCYICGVQSSYKIAVYYFGQEITNAGLTCCKICFHPIIMRRKARKFAKMVIRHGLAKLASGLRVK